MARFSIQGAFTTGFDLLDLRQLALAPQNMAERATARVAIAGAGISGLTLAGVLSKCLGSRVCIDIYERGARDRDQGYGLDLDERGQEALARAGVYNQYWSISRPHSDSAVMYNTRGFEPIVHAFRPRLLQRVIPKYFGARPETNRGGMREILLNALSVQGNANVYYERGAFGLQEGTNKAELLGASGEVLGEYDLVVDAMGLHSTLRGHRVIDSQGKHYSGQMMIHGAFNDPDTTLPAQLMKMMGTNGTMGAIGRGYSLLLQRYGVGGGDNRTCFFYMVDREDEDALFKEMDLPKPSSRASGILTDLERKGKVQAWLKRDMGGIFDPVWSQAVDSLDRVTVRGNYMHGETTLREDVSLPLICIGDSLRNCGLGGGGNLAMHDALELADVLLKPDAFDSTGRVNLAMVRRIEPAMLQRKIEFHTGREKRRNHPISKRDPSLGSILTFEDVIPGWKGKFLAPFVAWVFKTWYRWDEHQGGAGSTKDSPIYPNVQHHLK